MDFSNYNFNSDNEIPLDVLRARFIANPLKRSSTTNVASAGSIPNTAKRILNGILALAILFMAYISLFELVRTPDGYTVSSFDYFLFNDNSILSLVFNFFSIIGEPETGAKIFYAVVQFGINLCLAYATLRLIISSIVTGISAITGFIKNDSIELEKGLANMLKRALVFLFFSAMSTGTAFSDLDFIGYFTYNLNSDFRVAVIVVATIAVGVAIAKAIIRYKLYRVYDTNLKVHILNFVANVIIASMFLSLKLFDYIYFSIMGFTQFFGFLPDSVSSLSGILGLVLVIMIDIVLFGIPDKFCKRFHSDSLRILTSGETLDASTRSILLNEDFNKNSFVKYIVIGAVGIAMCFSFVAELFGTSIIEILFWPIRPFFISLLVTSVVAEVTLRIFKKKR